MTDRSVLVLAVALVWMATNFTGLAVTISRITAQRKAAVKRARLSERVGG